MPSFIQRLKSSDGKYEFTIMPVGHIEVLRHGDPWVIIERGCNSVADLLYEIHERREQNDNLLKLIEGKIDECFAGGATMRKCRVCSDVVVGGPNVHSGCVKLEELKARVEDGR